MMIWGGFNEREKKEGVLQFYFFGFLSFPVLSRITWRHLDLRPCHESSHLSLYGVGGLCKSTGKNTQKVIWNEKKNSMKGFEHWNSFDFLHLNHTIPHEDDIHKWMMDASVNNNGIDDLWKTDGMAMKERMTAFNSPRVWGISINLDCTIEILQLGTLDYGYKLNIWQEASFCMSITHKLDDGTMLTQNKRKGGWAKRSNTFTILDLLTWSFGDYLSSMREVTTSPYSRVWDVFLKQPTPHNALFTYPWKPFARAQC